MTEEEERKICEECRKIKEDSLKCKKEWDDIDRWATHSELNDQDDDCALWYKDSWHPYEPIVDPFELSKYLKNDRPAK